MINCRAFLTNSMATAGATTLCSHAQAEPSHTTASSVGGYHYRLPSFKKGSRLLFQGDSITDMNWGRNQSDRNHYLGHSYDAVHLKTQEIFDTAAKAVTPEQWIWGGVHPLPQGHELIARNWLLEVSARWPKA